MALKIIFNGETVAPDDLSGVDPTCSWLVTCTSLSVTSGHGRLKECERFEGGLDNLTQALIYAEQHGAEFPSDDLTVSNIARPADSSL